MIYLTLEMPDEMYEDLRENGLHVGCFSFSFKDLETYKIKVSGVRHVSEECND